jgi:hypothetical protein
MFFNIVKAIDDKHIANVIVNGKNRKHSSKIRQDKDVHFLHSYSI